MDTAQKAQMLLFVGNRKPVFDELNARARQHLFKLRDGAEKLFVLFVGTKAHHPFNARAVVPTAVKQHHFTCCRQVRNVALEIPLCAFTVVGRWQCCHACHTGVKALGNALDHATLARSVAAFKQNHHLVALAHHPVLQFNQLPLQAEKLLKVLAARRLFRCGLVGVAVRGQCVQIAVLQLHFVLFVVAVHQVAANTGNQLFIG